MSSEAELDWTSHQGRRCMVRYFEDDEERTRKAVFHGFFQEARVHMAILTGDVSGQISYPVAIVEYEDKTCDEVSPRDITFLN